MPARKISGAIWSKVLIKLALGLDKFNNFNGGPGDIGHVLSVRKFSQEGRCTDDDIDTVNTCIGTG